MSHFTSVRSVIRDAAVLEQCLKSVGLRVERGVHIRGYEGTVSPTQYSIVGCCDRLEQDLGYALTEDGTYRCDFHDQADVGELMARVARAYSIASATKQAAEVRGLVGAHVSVLAH
jgi:hypothetical protein